MNHTRYEVIMSKDGKTIPVYPVTASEEQARERALSLYPGYEIVKCERWVG